MSMSTNWFDKRVERYEANPQHTLIKMERNAKLEVERVQRLQSFFLLLNTGKGRITVETFKLGLFFYFENIREFEKALKLADAHLEQTEAAYGKQFGTSPVCSWLSYKYKEDDLTFTYLYRTKSYIPERAFKMKAKIVEEEKQEMFNFVLNRIKEKEE
jgi:hypothetical protein